MEYSEFSLKEILINKLIDSGLYDEERADELVSRIEDNEEKMLIILGRLSAEEKRGGTKVQQCIRAVIQASEIPQALGTFEKLMGHELADPTFPMK